MIPENESRTVHSYRADMGVVNSTRYLRLGSASKISAMVDCGCQVCDCHTLTRDGQACARCREGEHAQKHPWITRMLVCAVVGVGALILATIWIGRS